jgi:hypothetical protein
MGDAAIVTFGFDDPDVGWYVVVAIKQDMDFNTTLGPAELAFAIAKPACSTELPDYVPEECLKKFCQTIFLA